MTESRGTCALAADALLLALDAGAGRAEALTVADAA